MLGTHQIRALVFLILFIGLIDLELKHLASQSIAQQKMLFIFHATMPNLYLSI